MFQETWRIRTCHTQYKMRTPLKNNKCGTGFLVILGTDPFRTKYTNHWYRNKARAQHLSFWVGKVWNASKQNETTASGVYSLGVGVGLDGQGDTQPHISTKSVGHILEKIADAKSMLKPPQMFVVFLHLRSKLRVD